MLLQGGVMGTHDEETRKFFKHSSVICVLSPRYASSKLSIFKQQASSGSVLVLHRYFTSFVDRLQVIAIIINLKQVNIYSCILF